MKMQKSGNRFTSILIVIFCFSAVMRLAAQEGETIATPVPGTSGDKESGADATPEPQSLYDSTLRLDIESASYYELYAWCRELKLDTAGSIDQLRQRLFQYFKIAGVKDQAQGTEGTQAAGKGVKTIIIKSASDSEYFKVEEIDENYLVLKGNVFVEVIDADKNVIHRIKANRIVLNQTANFITAEESVEYTIIRGENKPEVFKGESFSFNLDTWDGVFYKGRGTTTGEVKDGESIEFMFYGDTITRLSNDTVILEEGGITSSHDKEDPYWQIRASKIMVLAPGEWTIANAVLCIGRVPMLYIPFFFYPGDELFFSPVIGYRDREGNFVQTTTYFIGKKEKKKSPFSFLRATEDTESAGGTEIHGLFLRHVKSKEGQAQTQNKDWVLKLMVDFYSRLGGFAGISANFPPGFKFNGGFGVSRSVYQTFTSKGTVAYTVFSPLDDLEHWNTLKFFGFELPLRYGFDTTFSVSLFDSVMSLAGNMEIYSDTVFPKDFYDRKEDMDISKLFGLSQAELTPQVSPVSQKLQFTWAVRSGFKLSRFAPAPYINNMTIDYLNTELSWSSRTNATITDTADPFRMFYFPDRLILPNFKTTVEGEILRISSMRTGAQQEKKNAGEDPGKGFRIPDEVKDLPVESASPAAEEAKSDLLIPGKKESLRLPDPRSTDSSFTLSYSLSPLLQLENQFNTDNWASIEQVNYSFKYSHFINELPFTLISITKLFGDLITLDSRATVNESFKMFFNRASSVTDALWNQLLQTDYAGTFVRISDNTTFTVKPFLDVYGFTDSTFNYRLNWMLYTYKNNAAVGAPPVFEGTAFQWTSQSVSVHSLDTLIQYKIDQAPVRFTAGFTLPPIDPKADSTLDFYLWLFRTNANISLKPFSDVWRIDLFTASETLDLPPVCSITETYRYDYKDTLPSDMSLTTNVKLLRIEETKQYLLEQQLVYNLIANEITTYKAIVKFYDLSSEFVLDKIAPLAGFDEPSGVLKLDTANPRLVPSYVKIDFNSKVAEYAFWKQRVFMDLRVNTSGKYTFQRFTDSTLTFNLTFTVDVAEFLTIKFDSQSYNNNVYRYVPGAPEIVATSWINPIEDLVKSFNFFDVNDRMESNFKVKKLSATVLHKMYDWDFGFAVSGEFQNDASSKQWIWMPSFSISIQWHDIPEIKKEMKGDYYNPLNIWT